MALTTILNGNLAASTASAWVAVPAATTYTVQCVGIDLGNIEYSIDGTNPFRPQYASPDQPGAASRPAAFTLRTPVLWARVNNQGSTAVNGILATIANV